MVLKAIECFSQFDLGKALYPNSLELPKKADDTKSLMDFIESSISFFYTPILLFSAVLPFSTALQSFGYRPLSAWQGRIIYLSPLAFKGIESISPEDHKDKVVLGSKYFHRIVQVALALAILRISQKKGYHHTLGAISGVAYVYFRNKEYLSVEQIKITDCAVIILKAGLYFQYESSLSDKAFVIIRGAVYSCFTVLIPIINTALENFIGDLTTSQKEKIDEGDQSFLAQLKKECRAFIEENNIDLQAPRATSL